MHPIGEETQKPKVCHFLDQPRYLYRITASCLHLNVTLLRHFWTDLIQPKVWHDRNSSRDHWTNQAVYLKLKIKEKERVNRLSLSLLPWRCMYVCMYVYSHKQSPMYNVKTEQDKKCRTERSYTWLLQTSPQNTLKPTTHWLVSGTGTGCWLPETGQCVVGLIYLSIISHHLATPLHLWFMFFFNLGALTNILQYITLHYRNNRFRSHHSNPI